MMTNLNIKTKVVHSKDNCEWKVVSTIPGTKYKLAVVPYVYSNTTGVLITQKEEARQIAQFISDCFNNPPVKNTLKVGIVAKDEIEFEEFVNKKSIFNNENVSFIFIPNVMSTNSLNLDMLLLANESMIDVFNSCLHLIRS